MQVPAEKRIKVADTLRLLFHYCNIVNLTLGLIVLGVGISLVLSPFPSPIPPFKEISIIYGTLLITAVIVILMGMLGVHGCYWVQENRLKFYAVSTIIAIVLEAGLGSMSIIKEQTISDQIDVALSNFKNMTLNDSNHALASSIQMVPDSDHTVPDSIQPVANKSNASSLNCTCTEKKNSHETVTQFRLKQYDTNVTYKKIVDNLHTVLSCCSFPKEYYIDVDCCSSPNKTRSNVSCCSFPNETYIELTSCYHLTSGSPLPACNETFKDIVSVKLIYIRCLAFMLVPIQLFCLGFDLMVLKTLQVTREYDKLERELSNKRREKRNSMGYTTVSDVENIAVSLGRG